MQGGEHIIKGVSVKIGEASPKGREQGGGRDHDRGGNRFGGYDGGYGRGGGNMGGFGNPAQQGENDSFLACLLAWSSFFVWTSPFLFQLPVSFLLSYSLSNVWTKLDIFKFLCDPSSSLLY